VKLPQIIVTAENAVERARFPNPYAKAKAIAAYNMAERVADMDVKGRFMMKNPEEYIPMVAAAHELISEAARLAREAREIEKQSDSLVRMPHAKSGEVLKKAKLMEKPI
jgi:methylenetetrahydromethanopterin dehydrogenase